MAIQMSDEKNNFAFSHHQPSLNQFKHERHIEDKHMNHVSLQTPILELNNQPFFNQTSSAVSPSDALNNFVSPHEILNTYTTATSSTSTSTTTRVYNDLNQTNQMNSLQHDLNHHHPLSIPSNLLSAGKQQELHQNDYLFANTQYTSSAQPISQYASNLISHQTDLNDNLTSLNHSHMTAPQEQQHNLHHNLTYTELKPSNQQAHLIPNSVLDVTGYKRHPDQPPSYASPPSPTNSLSSQTSSNNLDNQDNAYNYGESSVQQNRRRYPGQSLSQGEKKSRMTKKQKYDAMINEEKALTRNNEQLKNDIKDLENMIIRYKQTIMNTVKTNRTGD